MGPVTAALGERGPFRGISPEDTKWHTHGHSQKRARAHAHIQTHTYTQRETQHVLDDCEALSVEDYPTRQPRNATSLRFLITTTAAATATATTTNTMFVDPESDPSAS